MAALGLWRARRFLGEVFSLTALLPMRFGVAPGRLASALDGESGRVWRLFAVVGLLVRRARNLAGVRHAGILPCKAAAARRLAARAAEIGLFLTKLLNSS